MYYSFRFEGGDRPLQGVAHWAKRRASQLTVARARLDEGKQEERQRARVKNSLHFFTKVERSFTPLHDSVKEAIGVLKQARCSGTCAVVF